MTKSKPPLSLEPRPGLGWGGMPLDVVEADLAAGRLVRLTMNDPAMSGHVMTLSAVYPTATPPGPAGRWLIEQLRRDPPAVLATAPDVEPKQSGAFGIVDPRGLRASGEARQEPRGARD